MSREKGQKSSRSIELMDICLGSIVKGRLDRFRGLSLLYDSMCNEFDTSDVARSTFQTASASG